MNLGTDGGNLYATWDTQTSRGDVGWLSVSTDGGKTWDRPVRVTPGHNHAVHILASAGGPRGIACVGWQTDALRPRLCDLPARLLGHEGMARPGGQGFARLRELHNLARRHLGPRYAPGSKIAVSWGSAVGTHKDSEIWAATVRG